MTNITASKGDRNEAELVYSREAVPSSRREYIPLWAAQGGDGIGVAVNGGLDPLSKNTNARRQS